MGRNLDTPCKNPDICPPGQRAAQEYLRLYDQRGELHHLEFVAGKSGDEDAQRHRTHHHSHFEGKNFPQRAAVGHVEDRHVKKKMMSAWMRAKTSNPSI